MELECILSEKGGGWCSSIASCSARAMTMLGSSTYFEDEVDFQGVLSSDPSLNPGRRHLCVLTFFGSAFRCLVLNLCLSFVVVEFFNWNRVKIRYCDGASFAGHPEAEFKVIKGFW